MDFLDNIFNVRQKEFIECLQYVDRTEDIQLYRTIEKLLYGKCNKEFTRLSLQTIREIGCEMFVESLRTKFCVSSPCEKKIKRKNIKENMIENYVIKNKKNKQCLNELNFKIFLKTIPNKNIIVKNGDIVNIIM